MLENLLLTQKKKLLLNKQLLAICTVTQKNKLLLKWKEEEYKHSSSIIF